MYNVSGLVGRGASFPGLWEAYATAMTACEVEMLVHYKESMEATLTHRTMRSARPAIAAIAPWGGSLRVLLGKGCATMGFVSGCRAAFS